MPGSARSDVHPHVLDGYSGLRRCRRVSTKAPLYPRLISSALSSLFPAILLPPMNGEY
jgi:hypothetical protein